jgi:hypothetical protein
MVGNEAAVNILLDATFAIRGTTGGDNGNPVRTAAGSGWTTFKADRVEVESNYRRVDHGTAQNMAEFNRIEKLPQRIVVETKLQKATAAELQTLLLSAEGTVVLFMLTAQGANVKSLNAPSTSPLGGALVAEHNMAYAVPSTLRFVLEQYGTQFVMNAAAKESIP